MSVYHIRYSPDAVKKDSTVHYMPCHIKYDGPAAVSKYFDPIVKVGDDGPMSRKASFRGHPVYGKVIELPKNYIGVVLKERAKPFAEDAERDLYVVNTFKTLTYWNWDKTPTENDAFLSALDWIDIAEALAAPVEDVEEDPK